MSDALPDDHDPGLSYQDLLEFLYRAPVGLLRASSAGDIELLNPVSSQLLMPLVGNSGLDNLFRILDPVAPQLRALTEAVHAEADAVVCDSLRLRVPPLRSNRPGSILSLSLLHSDPGTLIAVLFDATGEVLREQERLARKITSAVRTDPLTRLPNRLAAEARIERALRRVGALGSRGVALIFLNADRFRQLNDGWGQSVADRWLAVTADRLRTAIAERRRRLGGDHGDPPCVARVGADEFLILVEDTADLIGVTDFVRQLIDRLAEPMQIQGSTVSCTFSAGVLLDTRAFAPDASKSPLEHSISRLHDAGLATAAAKRAGGDRLVLFREEMRAEAGRIAAIESALRQALQADELFVVYQPVVALPADAAHPLVLRGVEALVRWNHPVRGVLAPAEFIAVAEECGLIGAIGDRVLALACRQFLAWQQTFGAAAPGMLAVNLSRAQLAAADWPARLMALLAELGLPAQQLQLEITESLAAQDESLRNRLHELRALGISLALDDFGTGYSSLSCLHLLPVDTVKIDRSFVAQADSSAHHRALISATVTVAASLGMRTIAEGIETAAQAAAVLASGCAIGQGYLYGRPMSPEALSDWLTRARSG